MEDTGVIVALTFVCLYPLITGLYLLDKFMKDDNKPPKWNDIAGALGLIGFLLGMVLIVGVVRLAVEGGMPT
jgi:hypothetical protein